jgi:hypothetical protein
MPTDDLPIHFPNSVRTANGDEIRVPADVVAQWDMLRWAKSRGGVLLADRHGPVYVAGGELSQVAYKGAGATGDLQFIAATKTITAAGADFSGLQPGQPIQISGAAQAGNNKTVTLAAVTRTRLTTVQTLVNENSSTATLYSPFSVRVSACEGWPLEEIAQEERVAVRRLSATGTTLAIGAPAGSGGPALSLIGMSASRDGARITTYPVTLPSAARATTFLEVTNVANTIVPLWAVMADPARGVDFGQLHDLRLRPYQLVCQDRTTDAALSLLFPYDTTIGWYILRNYRLWLYAPANSLFEVCAWVGHIRPYDPDYSSSPILINLQADRTLERRLSLCINGQIASSVDATAGVEIVSGLAEATAVPNQYAPNIVSREQTLQVRLIFRSLANAIHDICPAVFIARGQRAYQYVADVRQPQIWARPLAPQPQFALDDSAGGTA